MAIINQANRELQVKIVYYGPALGGKTTNLVQVHDHVQTAQGNKGKLVSLATSSDRTLFFDFLPIEAMAIKGFKTKFQLYTVPGQVIYNTTRQLVLRGVDGIVFVADSQYDKMEENVKSFANLEENLKALNLNIADIPFVLQFNKRDLPNVAPVEYMDFLLNDHSPAAAQIPQRKQPQSRLIWPPFLNSSKKMSPSWTTRWRSCSSSAKAAPRSSSIKAAS